MVALTQMASNFMKLSGRRLELQQLLNMIALNEFDRQAVNTAIAEAQSEEHLSSLIESAFRNNTQTQQKLLAALAPVVNSDKTDTKKEYDAWEALLRILQSGSLTVESVRMVTRNGVTAPEIILGGPAGALVVDALAALLPSALDPATAPTPTPASAPAKDLAPAAPSPAAPAPANAPHFPENSRSFVGSSQSGRSHAVWNKQLLELVRDLRDDGLYEEVLRRIESTPTATALLRSVICRPEPQRRAAAHSFADAIDSCVVISLGNAYRSGIIVMPLEQYQQPEHNYRQHYGVR